MKETHTVLVHTVVRRNVKVPMEGAFVVGKHTSLALVLALVQEGIAVQGKHISLALVLALALEGVAVQGTYTALAHIVVRRSVLAPAQEMHTDMYAGGSPGGGGGEGQSGSEILSAHLYYPHCMSVVWGASSV